MANIANFVSVAISIQDLAPSAPNFGTLLIVAASAIDSSNVYTFDANPDGLAAYLDAGGDSEDFFYKALSAINAQNPHTSQVKFFSRGAAATTDTHTLTPINVAPGKIYRFLVNNTEVTYTADADDTATDVAAALEPLIEAVTGAASSVASSTITVTADGQEDVYFDQIDPSTITYQHTTADSSVDDDLAAAAAIDSDFYGIVIDSQADSDIADAAAYAEANTKLFLAMTFDGDSQAGNGVLATLNTAGYHRTGVLVAGDQDNPPSAALMGRQLSLDPGASSFSKKNLSGVSADKITATIYNAVDAKNGITYSTTLGVAFTSKGCAVSGRQLHVTRDIDWLKAEIEVDMLTEMVNAEKIEMSDAGITVLEKSLRATLSRAEGKGVVLPGWTVTTPKKSGLSTSDVNSGIVRGLNFQAESGKGVEKVIISGTVR